MRIHSICVVQDLNLRAYVLRPIRRAEQKKKKEEEELKFKSRDYNTMKQCIEHKSIYHIYTYIRISRYIYSIYVCISLPIY